MCCCCDEACYNHGCAEVCEAVWCTPKMKVPSELRREARCYVGFVTFLVLLPTIMATVMLLLDPLAYPKKTISVPNTWRSHRHRTLARRADGSLMRHKNQLVLEEIPAMYNMTVPAYGVGKWSEIPPETREIRTTNLSRGMIFYGLITMLFISYYRTHLTDPGGPNQWRQQRPDLQYPPTDPDDVEAGEEGTTPLGQKNKPLEMGHCRKCDDIKPPRVSHCSMCERCIMRMDHHCPWVGNCVGFLNHKFFLLFLFYAALATGYYGYIFIQFFVHMHKGPRVPTSLTISLSVLLPFSTIISLVTFFGVLGLLGWSLFLLAQNKTQVEYTKESGTVSSKNPFNRGILRNFQHVLGHNVLLWLIPVNRNSMAYHLKT